jgi:hypothetical protein
MRSLALIRSTLAVAAAIALCAPLLCVPAQCEAQAADEALGDVALLEAVIKAKGRDKASAEEVAKAYHKLARGLEAKGDVKAATAVRERMVEWFDKLELAKDGGLVAQLTAQARLKVLEPLAQRELTRRLVEGGKPLADSRKVLEAWHEAVVAGLKPLLREGSGGKDARPAKPGLIERLQRVVDYRAAVPMRQAGLLQGQLAVALASEATALAAVSAPDMQAQLLEQSKQYKDLAASLWEQAWRECDVAGQRDATAVEIRRQLSLLKPTEFPPLDAQVEEQLTPQQQQASKLAGLAQRASIPALKVKYLKQATSLDPANAQIKELLRAAERDLAAEQGAAPK